MTTEEYFRWEAKWEATMKEIKNLMFQAVDSTDNSVKKQKTMDKKI